jgi:hypothetical protein
MPDIYVGSTTSADTETLKKKKKLTESGYPELAKIANRTTDVDQAIKTKKTLNEDHLMHNSNGAYDGLESF